MNFNFFNRESKPKPPEQWRPKAGEFVRHKLRPMRKMIVAKERRIDLGYLAHYSTCHAGWECRWDVGGYFMDAVFSADELEPWEEPQ